MNTKIIKIIISYQLNEASCQSHQRPLAVGERRRALNHKIIFTSKEAHFSPRFAWKLRFLKVKKGGAGITLF